jgi:hypothetical protein
MFCDVSSSPSSAKCKTRRYKKVQNTKWSFGGGRRFELRAGKVYLLPSQRCFEHHMTKLRRKRRTFIFFGLVVCMLQLSCRSFLLRRPLSARALCVRSMADKSFSTKINNNKLIVVIAGPTATGKSDVAAKICASQRGMIVSADSVQAYRGVQIGANKPSASERKETPHILVDVADHTENYNAAEWRRDAILTIQRLLLAQDNILTPATTTTDGSADNHLNSRRDSILEEIKHARAQKGYAIDEPLLPVVCGGTMMYIQWLVHGIPG